MPVGRDTTCGGEPVEQGTERVERTAPRVESGKTSILVPVFNNVACVTLLHRSLTRHTTDHPYELILIDNHSTEPGMAALYDTLGDDPRVKILRNATNLGFGKANNRGLRESSGAFIALINSDMFFLEPWLGPALELFAADPGCAAVQGMVLLPEEGAPLAAWKTQTCGARFDADGLPQYHLPGLVADDPAVQALTTLEAFMGTGVILRRSVLEEVGFFDEDYDIVFMEDTDLSLRISAAGYRIRFAPQVRLVHLHSASMPYLSQEAYDRSRRANLALYRCKWPAERVRAIVAAQKLRQ
ncbi:MAG: glycosyltransferase family 2 protein [Magnetococcales bacterium]|nr:glycosyltransferase family 2 protein [Magnetococcales bacterium]